MADTEETKFILTADTKEFLSKMMEAKDSINNIGSADGISKLVDGLTKAGIAIGVLGAAAYAVKASLEAVFDAEAIRAVNAEFENLTQNAGISTDTLRSGLLEASHGLVEDTDLIKGANKALVEMGSAAKDTSKTLDIARQASAVFGGSVKDNWEQINQAIATGNTRILRHIGLKFDQASAEINYAKNLGKTIDELTDQEKIQARLNSVLEVGAKRFEGVNADAREATNTWQQFNITISEVKEILELAFEKVAGPVVKDFLKTLRDAAKEAKTYFTADFGEGADQAAAKVKSLQNDINGLLITIDRLEKLEKAGNIQFMGNAAQQLKDARAELVKLQDEQSKYISQTKTETVESEKSNKQDELTTAEKIKRIDANIARKKEQLALDKNLSAAEASNARDALAVYKSVADQEEFIEREKTIQLLELDKEVAEGKIVNAQAIANRRIEIQQTAELKIRALEKNRDSELDAADERYLEDSEDVFDGVSRASERSATKQKRDLTDWSKQGKSASDDFQKYTLDAFHKVGEGAESVGEAMRDIAFNMAADRADAIGKVLLLEGIFTLNPLEVAGGAALMALAGFLRSQTKSGGAGQSSTPGSAPSGSSSASSGAFGTRSDTSSSLEQQSAAKAVTINVQGSYFETEQTKTALVDLIRQNQDATDYKIISVGGGI